MGDENDTLRKLLYKIGVEANIRYDDEKRKVIVMSTAEYQLHQGWIDSWFTLVGQKATTASSMNDSAARETRIISPDNRMKR